MKKELLEDGYIVIRGYIPREEAIKIGERFIADRDKYGLEADIWFMDMQDDKKTKSASLYNPLEALEILCNSCSNITELVGEVVLPTYSFGRIYRNGDELKKHTDRPSCEISCTLHLCGDYEWGFRVEYEGRESNIILEPGDMIIYRGMNVMHSRDGKYKGETYCQYFLHYVLSRGNHNRYHFDTKTWLQEMKIERIGENDFSIILPGSRFLTNNPMSPLASKSEGI